MAERATKSIANRVAGIIGLSCLAVVVLGQVGMALVFRYEVRQHSSNSLELLSESVAIPFNSFSSAGERHPVNPVIAELGSLPGVERIRVFDRSGSIIWSLDEEEIGRPLPSELLSGFKVANKTLVNPQESDSLGMVSQLRARSNCVVCHDNNQERAEQGRLLGGIHVQASQERLTAHLLRYSHLQSITGLLMVAFVVVLTLLVMRSQIGVPLRKLNRALQAADNGNFLHRVEIESSDEFGDLADNFNRLLTQLTVEQASKIDSEMERDLAQRELGLQSELEAKNKIIEETNHKLKNRLNELSLLFDITKALTSSLDLDRVLEVINELIGVTLKFEQFSILLMNERRDNLECKYFYGPASDKIHPGELIDPRHGMVADAIRTDAHILVDDLTQLERQGTIEKLMPRRGSCLSIPMGFRNTLLGVLTFTRPKPNAFAEGEIRFLNSVARQAAMAILNARLYQEKLELSVTDDLTKLANRRRMQTRLELEWNRAQRFSSPMSVLMIDIDFFKRYNDVNGHMLGDQVLAGVAQMLTNNTRKVDTVARFGGEEFVIILPGQDKKTATAVADKLRRVVARTDFPRMNSQPLGHLSISLGVATYPEDSEDPNDLLDRADLALYVAKGAGRNRVKAYEDGMKISKDDHEAAKKKKSRRRRRRRKPAPKGKPRIRAQRKSSKK